MTVDEIGLKRATDLSPSTTVASAKVYIFGLLVICALTIASIIFTRWLLPNDVTLVNTIIGISAPLSLGLLGLAGWNFGSALDGRLTQLTITEGERKFLSGIIKGLQANPDINISEKSIDKTPVAAEAIAAKANNANSNSK